MKTKRLAEMSQLERSIMLMVWSDVEHLPVYNEFRKYERSFTFENKPYRYKCKYKIDNGHLRLIEAKIEHEQVTIDIMH